MARATYENTGKRVVSQSQMQDVIFAKHEDKNSELAQAGVSVLSRARIKCGRGPRTADRRNCGLSPADWPKIFDSSPQFLHRVAVRSPQFELDNRSAVKSSFRRRQCDTKLCKELYHKECLPKEQQMLCLSGAWSPQIPVRSLSCPVRTFNRSMYETVRILSLSPRKIQLGLRETVSKGRDRHPYIPVGLSRPSDWLSPSHHPIAPPPLLLVK
ncbi:hypothetical protein OUZ56_003398 [Daphnia magna]|uniref:Uncharacterized protein n=1 Tax=Daphnia magna TaxID=35525 RepID=A0ABR0A8M6_9CRUS|nr:hypothetical protein OUZ56_003398 [Daphnia magna]